MKKKAFNLKEFLINYGVIMVMIILVIITTIKSPNFISGNNLMNLLLNMSSRLVIALGIAGCVLQMLLIGTGKVVGT